jgi:hypothetical protein
MAIVAAAVVTAQLVSPAPAGAVAAFPTMRTALAVTIATRRDATAAAASALPGLVRSLPCYLNFCLVFTLLEPPLGLTALALALVGCLAAARPTWTRVPLANIRVES